MRQLQTPPAACEPDEISLEEEQQIAEEESQRNLGISFEEFKRRWRAGEYRGNPDPKVTSVAFWLH
ncbi:hypothetical protein K3N28_06045 [Glycomyces sp. TRM65418]|uniref:hypothetical protein n=1 Tax=Glycomyces sp. TRM65418 TaxID=2867006 RepID=UPI001CE65EF3|nr:hypothetical protein [Glycomyces sp. TRM65418]MCC3762631.1 hypothetical protein [Glycomyces sp. TRM65418]QZD56669.1 hypothetical protein K3N28_06005 [Glycomyces sp. TRM65418]